MHSERGWKVKRDEPEKPERDIDRLHKAADWLTHYRLYPQAKAVLEAVTELEALRTRLAEADGLLARWKELTELTPLGNKAVAYATTAFLSRSAAERAAAEAGKGGEG